MKDCHALTAGDNQLVKKGGQLVTEQDQLMLDRIYTAIDSKPHSIKGYQDCFDYIRNISEDRKTEGQRYGYRFVSLSTILRQRLMAAIRSDNGGAFSAAAFDLNRRILCWEGTDCFDSFVLYMEANREYEKQFYLPRRKQLHVVVEALQDLADRRLDLLAVSLPPGCGKTTLAMFFLCWLAGREPQKPMLTGSHNKDFLSGVYGELLRMLAPDGEYLFNDIFPDMKVISTNAKTLMIDLGRNEKDGQRFTTLEFTSVGAGNAGKVRAEGLLYCDDLVDGMETALSKDRLDKLWGLYATDLRQRKIGDCPELHIATRWSVHDVIGRLEQMYSNSERARFIVIPAMNENDESNFDYPIEAGFTTQFYREQRSVMDDASWRALYMNEPIEREGQLYPEETLRRYFELPDGEPDAILSVCDTKDRGSDYCVMPIAYRYGEDYYIADMVCDNGTPDVVESRLVMKLLEHNVHVSRFESNSAGGKIAQRVQEQLKAQGGGTKITTKYTTANKETRIIMASVWVKDHCLFADNSVVKENKEYRLFLRQLTGYTLVGKNKHDDVPDAMAQLYEFSESMGAVKVEVMHSPFRRF